MLKHVAVAACLLATTPILAAAVPVVGLDVPPVCTYEGRAVISDIHVESHTVRTNGTTTEEVVVMVNSTRTLDVNAVVEVSLETLDGRVVADGQATRLISGSGSETYTVDVTPDVTRDQYATVEVTVSK